MPHLELPAALWNYINNYQRKLGPMHGHNVKAYANRRMVALANDEKEPQDDPNYDYVPGDKYPYLVTLWHYHTLALLADEEFGVYHLATRDDEREMLDKVIGLFRRGVNGDFPTDEEWEAAVDLGEDDEAEMTMPLWAAWESGTVAGGLVMLVDNFQGSCATAYQNRSTPSWPVETLLRLAPKGGFADRSVDGIFKGIRWLIRKAPPGNYQHYLVQAGWMIRLFQLRWNPPDELEREQFSQVLSGNAEAVNAYQESLRRAMIDDVEVTEMTDTLRRLTPLREGA